MMVVLRLRARAALACALVALCAAQCSAALPRPAPVSPLLRGDSGNDHAVSLPLLNISGFSWLENLVFDGKGNLWMSEATRGQLWRVAPTDTGDAYNATLVLDGFRHVDGLVVEPDGGTVYAVAQQAGAKAGDPAMVVAVRSNATRVNDYAVVAHTPELPNGMKRDLVTGLLYLTVEGKDFLPTQGKVYEVDATTGSVTVIMEGFFWSDGIAIDNAARLLYVGELMTGHIYKYDLATHTPLGRFDDGLSALRLQWLDDFFVDVDCRSIVGAEYSKGNVVRIDLATNTSTVLYSGFTSPTAVLWGPTGDANFRATSLYVTEGGSFDAANTQRSIVEIPNARPAAPSGGSPCWTYLAGRG